MTKPLDQRLADAKAQLDTIDAAVSRSAGKVATASQDAIRGFLQFRNDVVQLREIVTARKVAADYLSDLERLANDKDEVPLGAVLVSFRYARLIGVQAYLSINWALADRLIGGAGRLLCPLSKGMGKQTAKLVSHFVTGETASDSAAGALFVGIRANFGWPIAISYALRNHFIHDAAQVEGNDFFEGPLAASAFKITDQGWNRILKKVVGYGVDSGMHRAGAGWPMAPRDDLRNLLRECENEVDDALGTLLGCSTNLLHAHIAFLLGED